MSSFSDFLNGGVQQVPGGVGGTSGPPDWYQQYMQGIAGRGVELADRGYIPYTGERQADFTQAQRDYFGGVRANQGDWQPAYRGAMGAYQGALQDANAPTRNWTDSWQSYMSPYTQGVVNEISRLGNRNLQENLLPQINDSFIGGGGFGSTRNAEMIGRAMRDTQRDISGQQSMALQQGYGTAANIFGADANRSLAGQQLAAQTGMGVGQGLGALGQLRQNMGYMDAGMLGTIGAQQQAHNQTGMDIGYQEFLQQRDQPWQTLGNLRNLMTGANVGTQQQGWQSQPYPTSGALQWMHGLYGLGMGQNQQPRQP